jgi:hypothetical protein
MFTPFVSMLLQEISTVLGDLQKTSHPNWKQDIHGKMFTISLTVKENPKCQLLTPKSIHKMQCLLYSLDEEEFVMIRENMYDTVAGYVLTIFIPNKS